MLYCEMRQYDDAIAPLKKALKINSSQANIYNLIGIAYDGLGYFKNALKFTKKQLN